MQSKSAFLISQSLKAHNDFYFNLTLPFEGSQVIRLNCLNFCPISLKNRLKITMV